MNKKDANKIKKLAKIMEQAGDVSGDLANDLYRYGPSDEVAGYVAWHFESFAGLMDDLSVYLNRAVKNPIDFPDELHDLLSDYVRDYK